ncbi:MAG: hypothetical protein GX081_10680 [Firmicutes bacterium]|nr:hypothetical protein [Bacillota bacterium]
MDRFYKGFFSGVSGGVVANLWSFFVKDLLHYSARNFVDWTAVVLYGVLPTTWYEFLLAFFTNLLWTGFLGIIFAYLLLYLTPQGYLIKGALYGIITSFLIYGAAILLRMPFFTMIPFRTAFGNMIGGLLWGVITARTLFWLDQKAKNNP